MSKISDLSLNEYLTKNNILVSGEYFKSSGIITESKILKQINMIKQIDELLTKYHTDGFISINSIVGRRIETVKVHIRKLRLDLEKKEKNKILNSMDIFLLESGNEILKEAEGAVDLIKNVDYLSLIKRSMDRNEMCIGRGDEGNLRYNNKFEIGKLKNVRYNLIEEDIYEYFKRIRRKSNIRSYDKYIDEFIINANLKENSKDYIKILLKIPYDALKQWYRYSEGRRGESPDIYLENMKESLKYESNIIKGVV